MTDVLLESLRAVVAGFTLVAFLRGQRSRELRAVKGGRTLLLGFSLIFFGTLVDITDNYPVLNPFVVVGDTPVEAFLEKVVGYLLGFLLLAMGIWQWLPRLIEHQKMLAESLEKAQTEVKVLRGCLPVCSSCKKIRDDQGYWEQIEAYITEHSEAKFTHSLCPACAESLYPGLLDQSKGEKGDQGPAGASEDGPGDDSG